MSFIKLEDKDYSLVHRMYLLVVLRVSVLSFLSSFDISGCILQTLCPVLELQSIFPPLILELPPLPCDLQKAEGFLIH